MTSQEKQRNRERAKVWAKANPERAKANHKKYRETKKYKERHRIKAAEWRKQNPDKANAATKRWDRKHPLRRKVSRHRRNGVDVSIQSYLATLKSQNNACAICLEGFDKMSPHIDHCHSTGRFRGLLCANCNRGLGMFKDKPLRLVNAALYLGML